MSSNIEVQRICQYCKHEFTAKTTVTKYCSHNCASRAHKERVRQNKIHQSNVYTRKVKFQSIEELQAKEFLTVRDVATLLQCSVRSVYYYIEDGTIQATNLGQRLIRIKRSDINKIFEAKKVHNQ